MGITDLKELCARVSTLMDEVDEQADLATFLESVEELEPILVGAAVARAYLSGAVNISQKALPLITASESALSDFLESLDEDDDGEEEDEDE